MDKWDYRNLRLDGKVVFIAGAGGLGRAIAPTFIPTSINRETLAGKFKQRLIDRTPFRRLGKPGDVVGPVVFLASDVSNFITGPTIPIDGGWLSG